jgi:hypothetical protein
MGISKLTWIGICCVMLGVGTFLGRYAWIETRTNQPVHMRVSLKPGHVRTPRFHINKDWPFEFRVDAKVHSDHHQVVCLMGYDIPSDECTEATVIGANWVLFDNGRFVAQGETNRDLDLGGEEGNGSTVTAYRRLGGFDLKKGHSYVLDVNFTKDGSILAVTDPHLTVVAIDGGFYKDAFIGLFVFYSLPCALIILVGLSLLTFSVARYCRRSKRARAVL